MRVPGDDREIRIDSVRAQVIEVGLALGDGYVDVLRPVQEHAARSGIRDERVGVGDGVPLGHVLGSPAHDGVDRTVAEALSAADPQAGDRRMEHDEVEGSGMRVCPHGVIGEGSARGGPCSESPARGVAEECAAGSVDALASAFGQPLVDRDGDVAHGRGPGEFIGAVFDVPHRESMGREVEGGGLLEAESPHWAPVATVDDDDERGMLCLRDEPLAELPRVLAVGLDEAAHRQLRRRGPTGAAWPTRRAKASATRQQSRYVE